MRNEPTEKSDRKGAVLLAGGAAMPPHCRPAALKQHMCRFMRRDPQQCLFKRGWANRSSDPVARPASRPSWPPPLLAYECRNRQKCLVTKSFRRQCPHRQGRPLRLFDIFQGETPSFCRSTGGRIGVCLAQRLQPWASAAISGRNAPGAGPRRQRNLTAIGPARHATPKRGRLCDPVDRGYNVRPVRRTSCRISPGTQRS